MPRGSIRLIVRARVGLEAPETEHCRCALDVEPVESRHPDVGSCLDSTASVPSFEGSLRKDFRRSLLLRTMGYSSVRRSRSRSGSN